MRRESWIWRLSIFHFVALWKEAVELLAERAERKGLELLIFVDETIPDTVQGDPGRLRQILTNLIGNAIKFTETGEVLVEIKYAQSKEVDANGKVLLHCAVTDTGVGIPAAARDRLFQSFSQVDASTTRKYGGTGLGLAISQQLLPNDGRRNRGSKRGRKWQHVLVYIPTGRGR